MAARDLVLIAAIFFTIATSIFVVSFVGRTMATDLVTKPVINESSTTVATFGTINNTIARFDLIVLGAFLSLCIGVIVTSWFIPSHPIFMLSYIIVWCISLAISAILANSWESITSFSQFASTLATFPIANHLTLTLPYYIAGVGFLGAVILFGKPFMMGEPQ